MLCRSGAALRSRTPLRLESSSASYKQLLDPQGSRCISIGSTSKFVTRDWGLANSVPVHLQHRYQSTNASQPSVSTSPSDPPPSVGGKGKAKAKVELRPGPAKPSGASSPTNSTTATATQGQQKSGTKTAAQSPESISKPHPTKPPPPASEKGVKAEEKESLIEIAKKDVDDAAQHGILAPPPPDAGFARKLFHQAKELFVSFSYAHAHHDYVIVTDHSFTFL